VAVDGIELTPDAFMQVNTMQAAKLYKLALEFAQLSPEDVALDLYCGVGTLSRLIAPHVKRVHGVEINAAAVESARRASADSDNIGYECADAATAELPESSVVFVDPPRKGLAPEVLTAVVKLAPRRVVYLSCDPATLSRDLKTFAQSGYTAVRVTALDMFPCTTHVETVTLLTRQN
ncbi:MAG: methyltransferase domain-containing protein, partial [Oscillospiraceae bacterium]|nr:methyltransferase domain-containing protein [Oscillospiraceae bacterium]